MLRIVLLCLVLFSCVTVNHITTGDGTVIKLRPIHANLENNQRIATKEELPVEQETTENFKLDYMVITGIGIALLSAVIIWRIKKNHEY